MGEKNTKPQPCFAKKCPLCIQHIRINSKFRGASCLLENELQAEIFLTIMGMQRCLQEHLLILLQVQKSLSVKLNSGKE